MEDTPVAQSAGNGDAIESALAESLRKATTEGQWTLVAQLASELQARRESRAGVVDLTAERKRRSST